MWRHRFPPTKDGRQRKAKKLARSERCSRQTGPTFAEVAEDWNHTKTSGTLSERHSDEVAKKLARDILPALGSLPIEAITTQDCLAVLRAIEQRGSNETAKRTLGVISLVIDYAVALGHCPHNPAHALKRHAPVKQINSHFPRIGWGELPELLGAMRANTIHADASTLHAMRNNPPAALPHPQAAAAVAPEDPINLFPYAQGLLAIEGASHEAEADALLQRALRLAPVGELAERIKRQQRRLADRVPRANAQGLPRIDAVTYLGSALEAYAALDLAGRKQLLAEAAAVAQKGLAINDPNQMHHLRLYKGGSTVSALQVACI